LRALCRGLIQATLHLVNREYAALADDFITLGLLPPGSDRAAIVPALTGVFQVRGTLHLCPALPSVHGNAPMQNQHTLQCCTTGSRCRHSAKSHRVCHFLLAHPRLRERTPLCLKTGVYDHHQRADVIPCDMQEAMAAGVSNISFGELSGNLGAAMYQYSFRIPAYYTLLVRRASQGVADWPAALTVPVDMRSCSWNAVKCCCVPLSPGPCMTCIPTEARRQSGEECCIT
jgi:hypothetical protein